MIEKIISMGIIEFSLYSIGVLLSGFGFGYVINAWIKNKEKKESYDTIQKLSEKGIF